MSVDPERSGSEVISPYAREVVARNQRFAEQISREEVSKFSHEIQDLNKKYPGLINPKAIEGAWALKSREVIERVLADRDAGLLNDHISKEPGIFITGQISYNLIEPLQQHMELYHINGVFNFDFASAQDLLATFNLHLPKGLFQYNDFFSDVPPDNQSHLAIYGRGELPDFESQDCFGELIPYLQGYYLTSEPSNSPEPCYIGRIEGAGGTLWQNPARNPDGTPINKQSAVTIPEQ